MTKPIQGIFFRDLHTDYVAHIIKEIWFDKVYDKYFADKKDLIVADVGANIGLFSLYASQYAAKIYAVEPSALHFETLSHMLSFNKLEQVVAIQCAIGNFNGPGAFYHNENTTMFSLRPEVNGKPDEQETVDVLTLDQFLDQQKLEHVDVLKVDVEGSEADIFGGEGFDKVKDKIDLIVGEYHQWCGINPNLFKTYFLDRNYSFEWSSLTEASMFVAKRNQ